MTTANIRFISFRFPPVARAWHRVLTAITSGEAKRFADCETYIELQGAPKEVSMSVSRRRHQKTKTVPLPANRRGGARGRSLAHDRKEPVVARDIDITRSPSSAL